MTSDREIEKRIRSRVGQPVRFKYPGTEGHKRGRLKARIVLKSSLTTSGVRYWDVIDRVEFPDESQKLWVRFGYYRQNGTRLRWAGQTSLAEPERTMRRLFRQGAAKADWFDAFCPDAKTSSCGRGHSANCATSHGGCGVSTGRSIRAPHATHANHARSSVTPPSRSPQIRCSRKKASKSARFERDFPR